jgi:hypothetical protein
MRTKNILKMLPVVFTKDELLEMAKQSMEKTLIIDEIENSKSKLSGLYDDVISISKKMKQGFEERSIPCEVKFNTPHNGKKSTIRTDTGETVAVENMTAEEFQEELELTDGKIIDESKRITSGYEIENKKNE